MILRGVTFIGVAASALAVNIVQLCSLLIRPFSQSKFRRFNALCVGKWWHFLVALLEKLYGLKVELEGKFPEGAPSALVLSNHQTFVDPLVILKVARDNDSLPYLKWFVKKSLVWIPFLGWGLWFLDCVFLSRNWSKDEITIRESFKKILKFRDPIWLISFVEGTRKSAKKLASSQAFSQKQGLTPFQKVLLPRYKGFAANVHGLRERIEFIYDLTLSYSDSDPNLLSLLNGKLGKVRVKLEVIPIEEIPQDLEPLKEWLTSQFRKKEAWLMAREKL